MSVVFLPTGWLRRFVPVVALAVLSGGTWAAAGVADPEDAAAEPAVYPLVPADPVLSARRLPRSLQAPLADAALAPTIQALLEASPPDSCLVVERDDHEVVRHNATANLAPASNQKLVTTWAALEVLGPEHTFRTSAVADAPVVDGQLQGDLWLVGGGDPVLTTDAWAAQFEQGDQMVRTRLEDLADAIAAAGITRIAGAVVGDESRYDTVRTVPTWAQRLVDQVQAGPLSALLVNEGIEQYPPRYVNRAGYTPTTDPAGHAAGLLAALLIQRGVAVGGPARSGTAPPVGAEVAAVESVALGEIVGHVNGWSNNTAAELLVKALDVAEGGPGTTAGGIRVVQDALVAADLPVDGVIINDGSGLDEGDRVSCELLHALLEGEGPDSALAGSLPLAGVDGTLRGRFGDSPAAGRLRAKTGTLRWVSALSGFAASATEDDTVLTFSYIANAPASDALLPASTIQQQLPLASALVSYPQAPLVADLGPRPPIDIG